MNQEELFSSILSEVQARFELSSSGNALHVDDTAYSYQELGERVRQMSANLKNYCEQTIALYASRTLDAYAGLLAIMLTGNVYVPLNPKFPEIRNLEIL